MSQYKPDGVNYPVVTVVNGSNAVIIQGVDATLEIGAGDYFFVQGDNGRYEVNADVIVYSGGNTTLHITTNYAGTSSTTAIGVFHRDFTVNFNLPLIQVNDLQAAELMARALNLIDAAMSTSTFSGDLTFTGLGKRIKGDFSNATLANKLLFQTTTANGNTVVGAVPLGTGVTAGFEAFNTFDAANACRFRFVCNGTEAQIQASISGIGTYLPITFYTGGVERFRLSATENRLQADFSNATIASRLAFQTSTVNALTIVGVLPNGTATGARLQVRNASDPTNSSVLDLQANLNDVTISSSANGTGTTLPLLFSVGGAERVRIDTAGYILVGLTALPSASTAHSINGSLAVWNTSSGIASLFAFGGTDTTNAPFIRFRQDATDSRIEASKTGTAAYCPLEFYTGGTERVRIDTSGNVGVGITPTTKLQVAAASNTGFMVSSTDGTTLKGIFYNTSDNQITIGTVTNHPLAFFTNNTEKMRIDTSGSFLVGLTTAPPAQASHTINGPSLGIWNTSSGIASLFAFGGTDTTNAPFIRFRQDATDSRIEASKTGTAAYTPLEFFAGGAERMRIDSSGNLLIGTGSAIGGNNSFAHVANIDGGKGGITIGNTAGSSASTSMQFRNSNGAVGSVTTSGSATSYNTSSDYRLKNNQQPLTGSGDFIDALQPKTWEWIADGSKGAGLIAHEAQAVSPSSVTGIKDAEDKDGKPIFQAMDYSSSEIIANMIAELQSLRKRVAELESK